MMHAARRGAPSGGTAGDTLLIVLKHLSSSDDNVTVSQRAARDLHRVSKQHQAEARATLRHLPLDRYYQAIMFPGLTDEDAVPWELLVACPNVVSWKLHPDQLEEFQWGLQEEAAAAASRVRRLEVKGLDGETAAQQRGLGVLLWACNQLEEVDITCAESWFHGDPPREPWLLMDPDSTSLDTVTAPPLPLRSWASSKVDYSLLAAWTSQQPLARTMRRLQLCYSHSATDISWVTALTGLRELHVDHSCKASSLMFLSTMTGLTHLTINAGWNMDDALRPLTGLRHLVVSQLPSSIDQLKQLTALNYSHARDLPPELGTWLPLLEQLEAPWCSVAAVPASLSRLTRLDLTRSTAAALVLPTTLCRLRQLVLHHAESTAVKTISSFTALEVLDVSESSVLGDSLTVLQPLTRLRHLNMGAVRDLEPASFTVLGALQQLTRLDLAPGYDIICVNSYHGDDIRVGVTTAACNVLAGTPPLPALEQLDISYCGAEQLAALGPWVGRLPALVSIKMQGCAVGEAGAILCPQLPVQVQQVHLGKCSLRELPPSLQRLSVLEVLDVSDNSNLQQLPAWLSQLRRLEAINLVHTGVHYEQEVLAHLPLLRCVRLVKADNCGVFNRAPHLLFGHSRRLRQ
jgi:Leucine-rich repeat (LRR) protein